MSQAHIEQFYAKAAKDPALVNKMLAGTNGPDDFIKNAVSEGKAHGYQFTFEEADAWIKNQQKMKASGELSDSQLEGVAGGKGATGTASPLTVVGNAVGSAANTVGGAVGGAANAAGNWLGGAANTVGHGVASAANTVGSWFSSW